MALRDAAREPRHCGVWDKDSLDLRVSLLHLRASDSVFGHIRDRTPSHEHLVRQSGSRACQKRTNPAVWRQKQAETCTQQHDRIINRKTAAPSDM